MNERNCCSPASNLINAHNQRDKRSNLRTGLILNQYWTILLEWNKKSSPDFVFYARHRPDKGLSSVLLWHAACLLKHCRTAYSWTDSSTGIAAKQSQELQQEVPASSPRRLLPCHSKYPEAGAKDSQLQHGDLVWIESTSEVHHPYSAGSLQLHVEATKHGSTAFHQWPLPN